MMKHVIIPFLAVVCAIDVTTPALADGVAAPWANSFETNTAGISIVGNSEFGDWRGTDGVNATVTNFDYSALRQSPRVTYPLRSATHTKVVAFRDGGITNLVSSDNTNNATVDFMLQPVPMDEPAMSAAISNSQMALFVNTSGYVTVYHAIVTNASSSWTPDCRGWTILDDGVFPAIASDKWVRVTVTMDYSPANDIGACFYQVRVNGHLFTNALAFSEVRHEYTNSLLNGTWFMSAKGGTYRMTQFSLSGSGMFDDLVITNDFDPASIRPGGATILTYAIGPGTISPPGPIEFAEAQLPVTTNFVMTSTNPYYHVARVVTSVTNVEGLARTTATYTQEWAGIITDGAITAYFEPILASHDTPLWWLAQYGLVTNAANWDALALEDSDGDLARNWEEYVAGTIPNDRESVLRLLTQRRQGDVNTITWQSSTNTHGPYVVSASTNITYAGAWMVRSNAVAPHPSGTNTFLESVPGSLIRFYRVSVTNY